jgi:hypothetical protein
LKPVSVKKWDPRNPTNAIFGTKCCATMKPKIILEKEKFKVTAEKRGWAVMSCADTGARTA